MRLFYINYADLSVAYGATVCIVELAKALTKQGHEVTVIAPKFRTTDHRTTGNGTGGRRDEETVNLSITPHASRITNHALRFTHYDFEVTYIPNWDIRFLRKIWFYLASAVWVTMLALRKRPDILYWGEMTYTITPYLVSKLTGIPYAIIAHGFAPDELRVSRWRMAIVKWCQRVYFSNASVVITVTPKIAERIHEVYGIPKEKLVPIENGVNLERFRPMDKFEARRQLGLPETGYIYIGWVGYFFPWSGVETLLEAAKKILAEFPNARFIIVGHGIWGTHLSDFAQTLGLKVHLMKPLNNAPSHLPSIPLPDPATWQVCFTGEVANELVPVFINSWDIATAPYPGGRNEKSGGSSMKIREYFGCGVPVVTTDVAGIGTRWLIGARETESKVIIGERGVLTAPDDADAFAEGLLILIRDASLREQMGKNAREFAETYCSWDEVARQTVKAFEGAIRKA